MKFRKYDFEGVRILPMVSGPFRGPRGYSRLHFPKNEIKPLLSNGGFRFIENL